MTHPLISAAALSYALGCLSPGHLLVRARTGTDLRDRGSGGTGARNAGRVLGRSGFALVFVLDCAKGALAVGAAHLLEGGRTGMLLSMLAVCIGHVFPAPLGFRGGKGASTALGALLVLAPGVAAASLALCALLALVLRYMTAALLAFAALPLLGWMIGYPSREIVGFAALAGLLLFAHRDHLRQATARPRLHPPASPPLP